MKYHWPDLEESYTYMSYPNKVIWLICQIVTNVKLSHNQE